MRPILRTGRRSGRSLFAAGLVLSSLLLADPRALRPPMREGVEACSQGDGSKTAPPQQSLIDALAAEGLRMDVERKLLALTCQVDITHDLLEYLLVGSGGSAHESLLVTGAKGSLINTALLLLGIEQGRDARWIAREPAPDPEERAAEARAYTLELPQGAGCYLYLAWREGEEAFCFRIEDLLVNLKRQRAMQRHRWVYTGSRFFRVTPGAPEVYAADAEQNYISIALFPEGNVLMSAALADCMLQTIWLANPWLLPERGSEVVLIFAREPMASLPPDWLSKLPATEAREPQPAELPSSAPVPAGGVR